MILNRYYNTSRDDAMRKHDLSLDTARSRTSTRGHAKMAVFTVCYDAATGLALIL